MDEFSRNQSHDREIEISQNIEWKILSLKTEILVNFLISFSRLVMFEGERYQ